MVADNCKELIPTTIIYLDELETGNFTSTGFTYDSANQTFGLQTMELIVETNCG